MMLLIVDTLIRERVQGTIPKDVKGKEIFHVIIITILIHLATIALTQLDTGYIIHLVGILIIWQRIVGIHILNYVIIYRINHNFSVVHGVQMTLLR